MNKRVFIAIGLALLIWGYFVPGAYRIALWIIGIIMILLGA